MGPNTTFPVVELSRVMFGIIVENLFNVLAWCEMFPPHIFQCVCVCLFVQVKENSTSY